MFQGEVPSRLSADKPSELSLKVTVSRHNEIRLPNNDITVDMPEEAEAHGHTSDRKSEVDENENENNEIVLKRKLVGLMKLSRNEYDNIHVHNEEDSAASPPTSPFTPTSIYTVGGSQSRPILEIRAKDISTRQCKFEMGEEWEQFQSIRTTKSISCPPSPLMGAKKDENVEADRRNSGYAASEPGPDIELDLTNPSEKQTEPYPFHFLFSSTSGSPIKKCAIVPNPHNKINQRFHSTLQCPCFLFFFFLCCLPAVHFMQRSDIQFKKGNVTRAMNYGKLSTAFYVIGSVVGLAFLSVAIYFAADYVKQYV
ncbi:uncharacterized protein LOC127840847 [Dreissena polymorpha]|uniref:Uncharacterized protein n=1 Tax=Dreissena polymorpha TaxID=45954 RepID=A0A9D4IYA0_DREPO|nr:uncharacterized protein LOC127840847 [Dreissena polymorpha]KAH3788962.1 hypothetical protein DPMN_167128 [Dreissena polymorpha]